MFYLGKTQGGNLQLRPSDVKINKDTKNAKSAVFTFEPLPKGFGHTLGNTLRRVLLTSLDGAAITQVKIKGASHQFATIDGVKEDVVDILLNLKQIRAKLFTKNPLVLRINKKGQGTVTAADIELSSDVEIVNKDQHIATLNDKTAAFEVELVIEPGVGYSPTEGRESSKIGVILLDALFSPVVNVNYSIEAARMGSVTDLDKLVITIDTDGTLDPADALAKSANLLRDFFGRFAEGEDPKLEVEAAAAGTAQASSKSEEDIAVEELPLPTRTINALKKHGIDTLSELAGKSDDELADIKNLGDKSIVEIKKLLEKEGLDK